MRSVRCGVAVPDLRRPEVHAEELTRGRGARGVWRAAVCGVPCRVRLFPVLFPPPPAAAEAARAARELFAEPGGTRPHDCTMARMFVLFGVDSESMP